MNSDFLDIDGLASRWHVNRKQVRAWTHAGRIPLPIRLTIRQWIWPLAVIEEFEARCQAAPEPTEQSA